MFQIESFKWHQEKQRYEQQNHCCLFFFRQTQKKTEVVDDHVLLDDDENILKTETRSKKLNSLIKRSGSTRSRNTPEVFLTIEKEFNLYEATGKCTPNMY